MNPFTRGAAPTPLSERGPALAAAHVSRARGAFEWPADLLRVIREALGLLTSERCSYCDGFPIDSTGMKEVDHFRPKSLFPEEVCEWSNLYLACTACNRAKRDRWSPELLRPDEAGYSFERFFQLVPHTGELQPNPAAPQHDQLRARETIDVLGLQRSGLCMERRRAIKNPKHRDDPDRPFRFL